MYISRSTCLGEETAKVLKFPAMARRPERNEEVVLTRTELKELQKRLDVGCKRIFLSERAQPLLSPASVDP
jgi:hypothetical protein